MARPQQLEAPQLLKAITGTATKPSDLAKALGVSRATVHRKLEPLLTEGLVVRVGEGPQAAYRLPSAQEAVERALALTPTGQVRLVLDKRSALAVREGLELFTRLSIGQLEEIRQEVSLDETNKPYPYEMLDLLSGYIASFKQQVVGFSSNASFGIHNPKLNPVVTKSWALMRALRHRLAWDQTPEGRMGTWHDEPMLSEDSLPGLAVLSDTPDTEGKPMRYVLEMPRECVELIGHAVRVALRIRTGDFEVLLDMAKDNTLRHQSGSPVSEVGMQVGKELVQAMTQLVAEHRKADGLNTKLTPGQVHMLEVIKACEAFAASGGTVARAFGEAGRVELADVGDSPLALTLEELPPGMMLNFKAGQYRVIAPAGEEGFLTIIAQSRSLQTVVQMARNHAKGAPARAIEF